MKLYYPVGRGKRGRKDSRLGRSRGGFSTKIHVAMAGLGNPVKLLLTDGEASDVKQAFSLLEGFDM